jgi:hypothetical protein
MWRLLTNLVSRENYVKQGKCEVTATDTLASFGSGMYVVRDAAPFVLHIKDSRMSVIRTYHHSHPMLQTCRPSLATTALQAITHLPDSRDPPC